MVKIFVPTVLMFIMLAIADACTDIDCQDGTCCHSTKNGEECCLADYKCDSKLGCVQNNNADSNPILGKCPPGMKLCYTSLFFDACCPHPMGVCCSDLTHCCPHGYECDVPHQKCNKKNSLFNAMDVRTLGKFALHQCGGEVWCPREDECCEDENGKLNCCRSFTAPYVVEKSK